MSTWNDGITGWNFGFRESDYSWDQRPPYSAYIHTDRRLYLPGEKVHIHAIIRKNTRTLDIPPSQQVFVIRILDSQGMEVKQSYIKPNEFGTLVTEYDIPEDARLGNFSVQISPEEGASYIENGWTEFQVEVFQKPNFTAQVTLSSPDIKEHIVQ